MLEALSSPSRPVRHLLDLATTWEEYTNRDTTVTPRYRLARRLRPADIDKLVEAYHAGVTVFELATQFNIHRTTVGRHLKERGIDTRASGLTPSILQTACDKYLAGWTLQQLAQHHHIPYQTLRRHLIAAGVRMRGRGGKVSQSKLAYRRA